MSKGPRFKQGNVLIKGRYTILEFLGKGSFGEVYKAYDARLDKTIAFKILLADPKFAQSSIERAKEYDIRRELEKESRTNDRLTEAGCKHIIRFSDIIEDEEEDIFGFTQEFVGGKKLEDLIKECHEFDEKSILDIGTQIAEAFADFHNHLIL